MRYLVLLLLLFCLEGKAQSYTFTLNECRVEATTGELRESFLVDRIRYFDRGDQLFIFDHESVLSVFNANITNYGRDSLKALIDIWIDSCNVVPIPTPPGPTALFANTTSLELDGSTEAVTIPNPADSSLSFGDNPFSLSIWVYLNAGGAQRIFTKVDDIATSSEWAFYQNGSSQIVFGVHDGNYSTARAERYISAANSTQYRNRWTHFTCTYEGGGLSGLKIYADGVRVDGASATAGSYVSMDYTSSPVDIGRWSSGGTPSYMDGKADQPTIFNKALSISEIKELMALRDYSYFSDTASIVSSWYMDAPDDLGIADGVTDRFGSNDGTGVNTTTADNLVPCITFPYDYQLETSALYTNLTPFQDDSASAEMGFAWEMDGVNENITASGAILDLKNDFSISAWVKVPTSTTSLSGVVMWGTSAAGQRRSLSVWNGGSGTDSYATFSGYFAASNLVGTIPINDNQWHHVFITVDSGDTVSIYVDGVLDVRSFKTLNSFTYFGNWFGAHGNGEYLDGAFSEAIIFNDGSYGASEALTLYNSHGLIDPRDTYLSANIVGYWNGYNSTNEVNGVLDLSGNGNNGTPANMDAGDLQYDSPRAIFQSDSAASFSYDGSTEYVTVPDTDSLSFVKLDGSADTSYTLSLWLKKSVLQNYDILDKNENPRWEWNFLRTGTNYIMRHYSENNFTSYIQTQIASINLNEFDNVVITYDGSATDAGMTIWVNGTEPTQFRASAGSYVKMSNTSEELNMGLNVDGYMSNVTIMKGIQLDQCQIQEIYNDGSPQNPTDWTFYQPNFMHWRMNAGDDPTTAGGVLDIIGNINGTSVNMDATNIDTESYPTN